MKTIIPKLPKYLEKPVADGLDLAFAWMFQKYGREMFDDVIVKVSPNARRGMYFANQIIPHNEFGKTPVASVSCKTKLYLYPKKTLGKYRQGVNIGYMAEIACCTVHELTHHVQFKRNGISKRGLVYGGEVDTTRNELEFLKTVFPTIYERVVIEEPSKPKIKRTKYGQV